LKPRNPSKKFTRRFLDNTVPAPNDPSGSGGHQAFPKLQTAVLSTKTASKQQPQEISYKGRNPAKLTLGQRKIVYTQSEESKDEEVDEDSEVEQHDDSNGQSQKAKNDASEDSSEDEEKGKNKKKRKDEEKEDMGDRKVEMEDKYYLNSTLTIPPVSANNYSKSSLIGRPKTKREGCKPDGNKSPSSHDEALDNKDNTTTENVSNKRKTLPKSALKSLSRKHRAEEKVSSLKRKNIQYEEEDCNATLLNPKTTREPHHSKQSDKRNLKTQGVKSNIETAPADIEAEEEEDFDENDTIIIDNKMSAREKTPQPLQGDKSSLTKKRRTQVSTHSKRKVPSAPKEKEHEDLDDIEDDNTDTMPSRKRTKICKTSLIKSNDKSQKRRPVKKRKAPLKMPRNLKGNTKSPEEPASIQQIKYFQNTTENLIPFLPFSRLVKVSFTLLEQSSFDFDYIIVIIRCLLFRLLNRIFHKSSNQI